MNNLLAPTYDELHDISIDLCMQLRDVHFDGVIAPSRGGLLFGMIASHFFNVPLIPVSYSSKKGKGDDKNHHNILPDIPTGTYLIVDDICDSGNTLLELDEYYADKHGNILYTAVWYCKANSRYYPSAWGHYNADGKMGFVDFPYEVTNGV